MNLVLFDDLPTWKNLLPLTFTRPISEIRIGILTIAKKWELIFNTKVSYQCQKYLSDKFEVKLENNNLFINGCVCPNNDLVEAILQLKPGQCLVHDNKIIAYQSATYLDEQVNQLEKVRYSLPILDVTKTTDVFTKNAEALHLDFTMLTAHRRSEALDHSVMVIGDPNKIFIEKGAKARACILNTESGPIYLGEESEIMEGSVVRGPLALCEHSVLKMSTKVYGATTIGPHSKVGGELNNSVIFGYSNKAHDGFLGNSVIGEWCNLGADTNNSNLKNNYANVKVFNYLHNTAVDTGLQFCGLIMGDHSKSGINTMFNTGTVVGVACNIYGGGFPPTHIPSFSWGGAEGFEKYQSHKLFETASKMFERRGLTFNQTEQNMLLHLYQEK